MQRRCESCGGYRFRTVNDEKIKCRQCGAEKLRDHVAEQQLAAFRADEAVECNSNLADLVS